MPSLLPRELTITYAGFTIGDSNRKIEDYGITRNETTALVEFSFVIGGYSSAGAFASACIACEEAFRKDRGDLVISNGSTLVSLKQSDNTGFDAKPEIVAIRDEAATGRSRHYEVRISFGLPADNIGTDGRETSSVKVEFDQSRRRTVTIAGVYTALSGNTARAQYESAADAYCSSVLTALTGTFERDTRQATTNDTNKRCEFVHIFEELIYSQGGANLDDSAIVGQALVLNRSAPFEGDSKPLSGAVQKIENCEARWSAAIDKTVTQDLVAKWTALKPWLVSKVQEAFSSGVACVIDSKPEYDYAKNKISAVLMVEVVPKNSLLSYRLKQRNEVDYGSVVRGVFDGKPFGGFEEQGPGEVWQQTEETGVFGGTMAADLPDMTPLAPAIPASLGGGLVRAKPKVFSEVTPLRIGEPGAQTDTTLFQRSARWRLYRDPVGFVSTSGGRAL